jgi:hypothetical protein
MCSDSKKDSIKSVDIAKVRKNRYTRFITHVYWPSDEVVATKCISKNTIQGEMQKFKNMLKTVFKPEYLPAEEVVDSNAVAVENLRDANDYILLKYQHDRREIQIQDGKGLYISVFPDEELEVEQSDLVRYVKSVAFGILNLPKFDEKGKGPKVSVSTLDIGDSKCGTISYMEFPPPKFWYSGMRWWSDGKNVLFEFGKARFNGKGIKKKHGPGPPQNMLAPRKFKKDSKPTE